MSGTYDSAVSKFLSEDKEKKQTRKQELVARMHRQAPSISNFYTEFSYLRWLFNIMLFIWHPTNTKHPSFAFRPVKGR